MSDPKWLIKQREDAQLMAEIGRDADGSYFTMVNDSRLKGRQHSEASTLGVITQISGGPANHRGVDPAVQVFHQLLQTGQIVPSGKRGWRFKPIAEEAVFDELMALVSDEDENKLMRIACYDHELGQYVLTARKLSSGWVCDIAMRTSSSTRDPLAPVAEGVPLSELRGRIHELYRMDELQGLSPELAAKV